jgi:adenylate cyclase
MRSPAATPTPWLTPARIRRIRLYAGLMLFVFVCTHLLNHALGLISLQAMEAGRWLFIAVWRNPVGSVLLLGALVVHLLLAFWSIYLRRHLRMPLWQAIQLGLGLFIPTVLVHHAVFTRGASSAYGYQDSYTMLVLLFWQLRPDLGLWQSVLLLVAWTHGCIGVHYWLRMRPWYARIAMVLYTVAIMLPVVALLGFAQAGRYVSTLADDPVWLARLLADAQVPDAAALVVLTGTRDNIWLGLAALLLLTLLARALRQWHESGRSVRIHYPNARVVSVPRGFTVLESSRQAGIAHAAVCGGRGRCSTCRIRVHAPPGSLPPPSEAEARVLARVGAGAHVRLACQLRPTQDLRVIPLIPPSLPPSLSWSQGQVMAGEEREVCVLFADLRGFTGLSEQRLPYDVVFLLNRYFEAVGDAIDSAGGVANQFTGDGVMALFGLTGGIEQGARQALTAAHEMQLAMQRLSADLHEELASPLVLGIGIHCGPTVVGHMGRGVATYLTAVGDTVNTASRLQDQTKQFQCQLIISSPVASHAALDVTDFRHEQITVRNRAEAIDIIIIASVSDLGLPPRPAKGPAANAA